MRASPRFGRHYRYQDTSTETGTRSAIWRGAGQAGFIIRWMSMRCTAPHSSWWARVGFHLLWRALACQAKHPVRRRHRLDVSRRAEMVILEVHANAFLHHMVRNLAGVLIAIGKGEQQNSGPTRSWSCGIEPKGE